MAAPELRGVSGTSVTGGCVTDHVAEGKEAAGEMEMWRATSLDMGWAQMPALWKQLFGALRGTILEVAVTHWRWWECALESAVCMCGLVQVLAVEV